MFSNKAPNRANWYFPNTFARTCCLENLSRLSSSAPKSCTRPIRSPLLFLIRPLIFIPALFKDSLAAFVGLTIEARPDFSAFAPSAALTPPSRIAAKKTAKSSTSPPSPRITGATFGIAIVISSRDTTVWFSTAFKKSIVDASFVDEILNADCRAMVAVRA